VCFDGGSPRYWTCWATSLRWVEQASDPALAPEQAVRLLPLRVAVREHLTEYACQLAVIDECWPVILMEDLDLRQIVEEVRGLLQRSLPLHDRLRRLNIWGERKKFQAVVMRIEREKRQRLAPVQLALNLTTEAAE
jgi:hypothetical protein